jgi:ABC-type multidrug transport system fused ATPase/permease subunit
MQMTSSQARNTAGRRTISRSLSYVGHYPKVAIVAVVALLLATGAQLMVPILIQNIIDAIVNSATVSAVLNLPPAGQETAAAEMGTTVSELQIALDSAPQALIYGWLLQFGYAVVPYLFKRFFLPDEPATLGGTWLSFALVNLGGVFLWASIFAAPVQGILHGVAYLLWTVSLLPVAADLWRTTRKGFAHLDPAGALS